jgi:hypothetical protein
LVLGGDFLSPIRLLLLRNSFSLFYLLPVRFVELLTGAQK